MMLARRGLLGALLAAPAVITTPGLLMPVKTHPAPGTYIDLIDVSNGIRRRFSGVALADGTLLIDIPAGYYRSPSDISLGDGTVLNGAGVHSTFLDMMGHRFVPSTPERAA